MKFTVTLILEIDDETVREADAANLQLPKPARTEEVIEDAIRAVITDNLPEYAKLESCICTREL